MEDGMLNRVTFIPWGRCLRSLPARTSGPRLMPHRALVDAPNYLRLGTLPSKALDATEAACREARRRGDSF
jgi:hypothetical protein